MIRSFAIAASMCVAVAGAWALAPREDIVKPGELKFAESIPLQFGDWQMVPDTSIQVNVAVNPDEMDELSLLYDEVLTRTYRNSAGDAIMLSIAYGRRQRQEMKIHRPELCYAAQGFTVSGLGARKIDVGGAGDSISGKTLLAIAPGRIEPVVYWIRIGNLITDSPWHTRLHLLREGLRGRVTDGILVRTSQIVSSTENAERSRNSQFAFMKDLTIGVTPKTFRALVSGMGND